MTVLMLFISCTTVKLTSEITADNLGNPPGTIKIAADLYLDQSEVRNMDYLEFLYWTKNIYGINSLEYKSIIPDAGIWKKINSNYASLDSNYLTHPDYSHFPVLGVSNQQARQFTKWRSDRVMEFTLIKYGVLDWNTKTTPGSEFTIEKYFTGMYKQIKPNPHLLIYPEYKLLDPEENTTTGFKNICTYKKWKTL